MNNVKNGNFYYEIWHDDKLIQISIFDKLQTKTGIKKFLSMYRDVWNLKRKIKLSMKPHLMEII